MDPLNMQIAAPRTPPADRRRPEFSIELPRSPSIESFESQESLESTSSFLSCHSSHSAQKSFAFLTSPGGTLDSLDGHGMKQRRLKRIRSLDFHDTPYPTNESSDFFADDNSDAPPFRPIAQSWLIPADHPYKILWDLATVFVSFIGVIHQHQSIRDRSFVSTSFLVYFIEGWFLVDMMLNFVTQHKSFDGSIVLKDGKSVWARYLTTWFVVDFLSLLPWERIYVQPIIDLQNRRNFFKKSFFRTKAVLRVTRILKGRHFKLFGRVARQTKHAGVGARGLLRLLIKYLPKYIFFWRRMKGVVVMRLLRHFHFIGRFCKNWSSSNYYPTKDDDTASTLDWEEDMDADLY
mmetsp:Transcript_30516/g.50386  ORF Transcript_30516/g.50386 Transcript_30516/m.50386 type:complete len:348 (-) Transcript_30516:67-1110(-)|eukprot:CAMPEP_0119030146 /NCGR_PEP_ID=MMETSP1176-20130426/40883_1 /TAXON_ID=265551 /ORGANISM="Synedropsis recta cf, Strain CCMP1620" /LENGTH=347 /DNA_ID=CAMNT_0006986511 /DNA_START=733 /DNA_END=1776 /DNA_ORIENTATION=-